MEGDFLGCGPSPGFGIPLARLREKGAGGLDTAASAAAARKIMARRDEEGPSSLPRLLRWRAEQYIMPS